MRRAHYTSSTTPTGSSGNAAPRTGGRDLHTVRASRFALTALGRAVLDEVDEVDERDEGEATIAGTIPRAEPGTAPAGACAWCGHPIEADDAVMPLGTGVLHDWPCVGEYDAQDEAADDADGATGRGE